METFHAAEVTAGFGFRVRRDLFRERHLSVVRRLTAADLSVASQIADSCDDGCLCGHTGAVDLESDSRKGTGRWGTEQAGSAPAHKASDFE
jgi:hypothetical protein